MASLATTSTRESFLHGKNAIITGGSGTIGQAISNALLSHGANIVITGRNISRLNDAKAILERSHENGNVSIFQGDVSDEKSVVELFQYVDKNYDGCCDLLVNNAGTASSGPTFDVSSRTIQTVLNTNVVGPFLCAREAMKRMKDSGNGGRIINIGSLSAISPRPHSVPYTTSKFALLGLTKSLALDGRPYDIAVGIIHPGNVISSLLSEEQVIEREATEGFIKPQDVAQCVLTMAMMPYSTNVLELTVMPTKQPLIGRG